MRFKRTCKAYGDWSYLRQLTVSWWFRVHVDIKFEFRKARENRDFLISSYTVTRRIVRKLGNRSLNPGSGRVLSSTTVRQSLWPEQPRIQWASWLFPQPRHEIVDLIPFAAESKDKWNCTATQQCIFMAICVIKQRDNIKLNNVSTTLLHEGISKTWSSNCREHEIKHIFYFSLCSFFGV
jgi:hypothetical protein